MRNDRTETNWCLAAYEDDDPKKPVVLVAKGSDGVLGMQAFLTPASVAYGFFRVVRVTCARSRRQRTQTDVRRASTAWRGVDAQTDVIDGHQTVKFGFVCYIGPQVGIMKRAKLTPQKGGAVEHFSVRTDSHARPRRWRQHQGMLTASSERDREGRGGASAHIQPFHVQFDVSTPSELSETAVMSKIQAASGSRNWVR